MKKLITYSGILLFAAVLFSIVSRSFGREDFSHCLVKYKSEWSKPCSQCMDVQKSYRVYFRNECMQKLDVKCAAQESDKRWRTFTRLALAPNDTIVAYACKGTGKYLYWVREMNDNTVTLPSDEEINTQYNQ